MGTSSSKSKSSRTSTYHAPPIGSNAVGGPGGGLQPSATMRFRAIADSYTTLEQVQEDLRRKGLESSNLIVAVDFTKSNEWTGKNSFGGKSLHAIGDVPSPYEEAISVIGRTLSAFDDDGLIPCYGFGDTTTGDQSVFSFLAADKPCNGLEQALWRYRELCPYIRMAGPTSFAPAIRHAARIVEASGRQYHILLLVADGQVSRSSDLAPGRHSVQERDTIDAIVEASHLPLSIIMVGVGDGPWDLMRDFDDALPEREFDNFQFVNFTELSASTSGDRQRRETQFALRALMEVPEQYTAIQRLGLLGGSSAAGSRPSRRWNPPLDPPVPPELMRGSPGPAASRPSKSTPASARTSGCGGAGGSCSGAAPGPAFTPAAPASTGPSPDPMFLCPITQEIMTDPVISADGYTYERAAIVDWLARKASNPTSPLTNQRLTNNALIPNHGLRSAIMEWKQKHGA